MPQTNPRSEADAALALVPALSGEHVLDEPLLDGAVAELNRRYAIKGLETMRTVGEYVIETFFGGDPDNFRARGKGHVTFRALEKHGDLRLSYAFIWRAVNVVDQMRLLPENIAEALAPTHHALLLPVKDQKKKVELAMKAVDRSWTANELEAAVRKVRARDGNRAGRTALPMFVKAVHGFATYLDAEKGWFDDLHLVDELGDDEAAALAETVAGMRARCEEVETRLKARRG